jgi:hypothetical protein
MNLVTRALLSVVFLGGSHLIFAQPTPPIPGLPGVTLPGIGLPGGAGPIPTAPTIDPSTGQPIGGTTVPLPGLPGGVSTNLPPQVNDAALLAEAKAVVQATIMLIKAEAKGTFADDVNLDKWGKQIRQTRQKHNLGVLHTKGVGVPLDFLSAYKLFKEAADEGLPQSQLNVGIALQSGMGAKKDFVGAYKYYTLAAAQGLPTAASARDNLAQFLTRFQIQAGQRMANGFMERYNAKQKYIQDRMAAERKLFEELGRTPSGSN